MATGTVAQTSVTTHQRRGIVNGDIIFKGATTLFALAVLGVAILMVATLVYNSQTSLSRYGFSFFTGDVWDPNIKVVFGARPYIFGTIASSLLALLIAGIVGVGVALLLVELHLPRWFSTPVALLVELLAAIPSVVYGVWGIFVLIPIMQSHVDPFLHNVLGWLPLFGEDSGGGRSLLTAALVLAMMIVPTVAAISREVIRVVPENQREAMLALGATRWEMIRMAVLPYARPGIIGALILALGRAVGETLAATMVIGNSPYFGPNLFRSADTLASKIANNLSEATGLQLAALFELGLILLLVSVVLNVLARLLVWSVSRGSAQLT
ncbi:MAG: phosphate transporter, inner rane subunit PstC [Chloroflexi bacterium]|nr:phosphate transporter, inner rane subunit PstC [Chloroflexota bacterium]